MLHYHLLTTVHLEQTSIHIINVLSECQLDMQAFIYLFILLSLIYHYVYLSGETSLRMAVFVWNS